MLNTQNNTTIFDSLFIQNIQFEYIKDKDKSITTKIIETVVMIAVACLTTLSKTYADRLVELQRFVIEIKTKGHFTNSSWKNVIKHQGLSLQYLKDTATAINTFDAPEEATEAKQTTTHLPKGSFKEEDIIEEENVTSSKEIPKILDQKEDKLQNDEHIKQEIERRKSELAEKRQSNPEQFPAYLNELLDNGYIHLYDHLFQMRALPERHERRVEIEKMTFSKLSHIVLETRNAIIQKVESSIPADHRHILFLLGPTGAGKSTTLCFLRGDKMVLQNDNRYKSINDDKIIEHKLDTSGTFLPTIETINGLTVIDFGGFNDTNGQLICLGMEFALQALLTKYPSKVLVLEGITSSVAGRGANASELGFRLKRLVDNKENCILGITQYSSDYNSWKIKWIERQQQEDRLTKPTDEENRLTGEIELLFQLIIKTAEQSLSEKIPNLLEQHQDKEKQLAEKQQERQQLQFLPPPETEEKINLRKNIADIENELLKQIGLGSIIRFSDLEDPNLLHSCLESLSKPGPTIRASSKPSLDADAKRLLENRFRENLREELASKENYDNQFKSVKDFEQSVLESSLIKTIFSQSNPEIGEFFHLAEMDPSIVRKFDKEIIKDCIEQFVNNVFRKLDMDLINTVRDQFKQIVSETEVENLKNKQLKVQKYILGLSGFLSQTPKEIEIEWNRMRREQSRTTDNKKKNLQLPAWATVYLRIAIEISNDIDGLMKPRIIIKQEEIKLWNKANIHKYFDEYPRILDQVYDALIKLKNLESIIESTR